MHGGIETKIYYYFRKWVFKFNWHIIGKYLYITFSVKLENKDNETDFILWSMELMILFYIADMGFWKLCKRKKFKISNLCSIAFTAGLNKLW